MPLQGVFGTGHPGGARLRTSMSLAHSSATRRNTMERGSITFDLGASRHRGSARSSRLSFAGTEGSKLGWSPTQLGSNPIQKGSNPTPSDKSNFDQALGDSWTTLRQVHIEEIEALQKEIKFLNKKIQQLAPGGKAIRRQPRAGVGGFAEMPSGDWAEVSSNSSTAWKEQQRKSAQRFVQELPPLLEDPQNSTEFNSHVPEESIAASTVVDTEPLIQTPRNGAPTAMGAMGADPSSPPADLMAEADLTSWVRNALKSELVDFTDKAILREAEDHTDLSEQTILTSEERHDQLHSNTEQNEQIDLHEVIFEEPEWNAQNHAVAFQTTVANSSNSLLLEPVIRRWRDLVLDTLALASKEMFVIKPCWVQSENFLRKAMRSSTHPVDLFSETPQNAEKRDSDRMSGRGTLATMPFYLYRWKGATSLIVDPQSPRRIMWALFGMLLMVYDLIMLPMQAFELPDNLVMTGIAWFTQIFWTIDMGVSAVTSYYVNGELEMRIGKIMKTYATSWLPVDCLITLPVWLMLFMGWDSASAGNSARSARYFRMLRFLRLMRLVKFESLWGVALDFVNSASAVLVIGMAKLMFLMILLNHLAACVWYSIGLGGSGEKAGWATEDQIEEADIAYRYLSSMHWTLTQFQGTSDIVPGGTLSERVYAVVFLLSALFVLTIFISSLTNRMMQFQNLHSQRTYEERVVRGYLSNHDISHQLSVRIKKYLEWKQRLKKSQEYDEEVFNILPTQLMMDLLDEVRGPTCSDHHPFFAAFRDAYPRVLRRLCFEAMVALSPMPGEQVFSPGDICMGMYFIVSGHSTYNVLTDRTITRQNRQRTMTGELNQKASHGAYGSGSGNALPIALDYKEMVEQGLMKVTQLSHGNFLSEATLWTFWNHVGSLNISSDSMLLMLNPATFEEITAIYTQAQASAVLYARRFVASLNSYGKHYTDFIDRLQVQEMIYTHNDDMDSDEEDLDDEDDYDYDAVHASMDPPVIAMQ